MSSSRSPLRTWLLIAFGLRLVAAWTRARWDQPDEWYQTVELGNLIANGFATYSQEITLHLRNLSWPAMLALPLAAARALAPESTHLRTFFFQLFTGCLDLAMVWGFWECTRSFVNRHRITTSPAMRHLGLALLVLPWFAIHDAIRPSAEHLCAIAAWIALGFMARGNWRLAGIALIGIGAMKYPAFLMSAGFAACAFWQALRERDGRVIRRVIVGISWGMVLGAVLFGAADWVYYGRPWESLWMYLQYNAWTGLASSTFGKQGVGTFLHFFWYRWAWSLLPLAIPLAALLIVGWIYGLRRAEPIAWGSLAYVLGHLLVAHKEERFMIPMEPLLLWLAYSAFLRIEPRIVAAASRFRARHAGVWRAVPWACGISIVVNFLLVAKALWGETWTGAGALLEVNHFLHKTGDVCAVISDRETPSVLLPWQDRRVVPMPAWARLLLPTAFNGNPGANQVLDAGRLAWLEYKPSCAAESSVLLHLDRPDFSWLEQHCEIQASGLLSVLPHSAWESALRRGWVSGAWYSCPARILAEFRSEGRRGDVEHPFARGFARLPALPAYGVSADRFLEAALTASPPPRCTVTCNPAPRR